MHTSRADRTRRRVILFSTLAAALIAGTAEAGQKTYDGKTLFRAFLFNSGPAVKLFPELSPEGQPASENLEAAQTGFMLRLHQADATFFTRFAKELQSGDRIRIRKAIEEARKLVKKVEPSAIGNLGVKYQALGHSGQTLIRYQFLGEPAQSLTAIQMDQWADLIARRLSATELR